MFPPERIVCLTEETVETLYLLGEQRRIVGISGYCVRPPEARREKPRVSAFTSADIPKILELRPDLVLTFSDLQADIVAALIRQGVNVHAFNQRTVAEIFDMIHMLGAMIGAADRAARLTKELAARLAVARQQATHLTRQPKVYFEEWDSPMISGLPQNWGSGRYRHWRGWIVGWLEFLSEAGAECAVVDGTANLQEEISPAPRPAHLLRFVHPAVYQEIGRPLGDRGANPQAGTVALGVIDRPVALAGQIAVQRVQGGPQLSCRRDGLSPPSLAPKMMHHCTDPIDAGSRVLGFAIP